MRSELLLDTAGDLLQDGRPGQAAALLGPMVGTDPDNAAAWLLLARARMELGLPAESLEAAREALRLESGAEALFWVSAGYTATGRHDLAVTAACTACAEDPGHPRLAERHGRALLAAGRVAEAEQVLTAAAEIAAYDADVQVACGNARFAAGRPVGARAAYERALVIDPQHRRARDELARLTAAERHIVDADTLLAAADEYAESLRIPAGGLGRARTAGTGVLAHVSAVVFAVCLVTLVALGVTVRTTTLVVPFPLLATLMCTAAAAAAVTTLTRRR